MRIEIVDKTTGEVLDGFEVPFLIAGHAVHIDGMDRSVYGQQGQPISGYVRDYDGFPAHRWRTVNGPREIEVVVDYIGAHAAKFARGAGRALTRRARHEQRWLRKPSGVHRRPRQEPTLCWPN